MNETVLWMEDISSKLNLVDCSIIAFEILQRIIFNIFYLKLNIEK